MVALKLQQFQYDLKKSFLRRLVFPMLLGQSELGGGEGDKRLLLSMTLLHMGAGYRGGGMLQGGGGTTPGGQLQLVLMRHRLQLSVKTCGP